MAEVIIWWIVLELLGLVALPLTWVVMRRLPDRGYAFAKTLGLVLVGYGMWLTSILQIAPFSGGLGWAMLLTLAGLSLWLLRRNSGELWAEISGFFRNRISYWLVAEILFTLAFAAMALIKAYAPDIRITEQYMDFGFLNSIIKNQMMPPPDQWMSGWSINYYYLGYSLMASLTLLTGVPTNIAYNLCMASLFALTVLGSFGLVYNLVQGTLVGRGRATTTAAPRRMVPPPPGSRRPPRPGIRPPDPATLPAETLPLTTEDTVEIAPAPPASEPGVEAPARSRVALPPRPAVAALFFGVLGALMVTVIGDLVAAQQVLQQGKTFPGASGGTGVFDYFWTMTRVIYDIPFGATTSQNYVITEFPLFSFLLNDMHPHVMALPLMLLALALGLSLLRLGAAGAVGRRLWLPEVGLLGRAPEHWLRLGVTAIALGMMYGLNTWDYPTYLLVVLACLAWPVLAARSAPRDLSEDDGYDPSIWGRLTTWTAGRLGWWVSQAGALVVLSLLLYLPFHLTFKSPVGGSASDIPTSITSIPIFGGLAERIGGFLAINASDKSYNWNGYIAIFGIFLFALLAFMLLATIRSVLDVLAARQNEQFGERDNRLIPLLVVAGLSVLAVVLAFPLRFPLLGLLLPMALFAFYLLRERLHPERWQTEEIFVLTLLGLGALITLTVEVFFLRDVFGNRMNTVFKFYYQTWVLWGVSAAYCAWWLVGRPVTQFSQARAAEMANRGAATQRGLADTLGLVTAPLWGIGVLILVGLGLIYPVYGPLSKINELYGPPPAGQGYPLRGLNGVAYLQNQAPADLAAILWLRDNAAPGTIAEAPGAEYNTQCYCGRVSALSGLATIMGWTGHEDQWRGGQPDARNQIIPRQQDMDKIYASTNITDTRQLMDKYGVRYVFVGTIEKGDTNYDNNQKHQYGAGLTKFAQFMTPVFQQGGTTVYMLPEGGPAEPSQIAAGASQ